MHPIHPQLTRPTTPLKVAVVGIGGTGSEDLSGLLNIHLALQAKGLPGLHVHALDPDTVSEANLVRQRFSPADLGKNKAEILTRRINAHSGTTWVAHPYAFRGERIRGDWDIVLSCVDTRAARAGLHRAAFTSGNRWKAWLDFGNERDYGQVIYGEPKRTGKRVLACATQVHPELMDTTLPDDDRPSCSAIEALMKQDLFVNAIAARLGLHLLWQALDTGKVPFHGYYFNLQTGHTNAISIPAPQPTKRPKRQLLHESAALPQASD